jgi:hypothetical protein
VFYTTCYLLKNFNGVPRGLPIYLLSWRRAICLGRRAFELRAFCLAFSTWLWAAFWLFALGFWLCFESDFAFYFPLELLFGLFPFLLGSAKVVFCFTFANLFFFYFFVVAKGGGLGASGLRATGFEPRACGRWASSLGLAGFGLAGNGLWAALALGFPLFSHS